MALSDPVAAEPLRARLQSGFAELGAGRLESARRVFTELCSQDAVSVDAYRGLAAVLWRQGKAEAAVDHVRQALALAPDRSEAHADLAWLLLMSGRREEAVPAWQRVLQLRPLDADAWHNFGQLLSDLKQVDGAKLAFERALELKPDNVTTLSALASVLGIGGREDESEVLWRRVLALQPSTAAAFQGLAKVQFERGHLESALETYRNACEVLPQSPDMHLAYGQVLEDLNDRTSAEREFRHALALRPGWAMALEALLTLIRGRAEPELLALAESVVLDPNRTPQDRANVGFGLGKALDAQARWSDAFGMWKLANEARRQHVGPFDRAKISDRIDRIINVFTPELFERMTGKGDGDARPVFIVGMPRSGTTLVEQILSAHPDATGYGELPDITRIARSLPVRLKSIQRWPEVLATVDAATLRSAAAEYIAVLQKRNASPAARLVDKAPMNFYNVGFIHLIYPNARIVWCRRDPRDICLSIYGENFALEQGFANDLSDLAFFYAEHLRLMRHWSNVLPGRLYECVYEDLVANPEQQARALVNAVGLPWNDACLRFHEQDRAVLTPSRWQVRRPMYQGSVGRWRQYADHLQPLLQALDSIGSSSRAFS